MYMQIAYPNARQEEDVDGLWEEVWDEARQCYHFYNPVANIASDTKPLSKHATQLALVDKQVRTQQNHEHLGRMGEGFRPAPLMSGSGLTCMFMVWQVRIYWPAEDQWFGGYVMRYNKSKRKHKIGYDDGGPLPALFKVQMWRPHESWLCSRLLMHVVLEIMQF
jgi:hypothetical protein